MADKENKKRYSVETKAKVVLHYRSLQSKENIQDKSINLMEKLFGVDRRTISKWIKKGDELINAKHKRRSLNLKSGKFKSVCEAMEVRIKDWILAKRSEDKCLSNLQYP